MTRGLGGESPANVQRYLSGVNYPANKDELVRKAQDNGAPNEVIDKIRDLPSDRFGGPQDVMKAYGQIE